MKIWKKVVLGVLVVLIVLSGGTYGFYKFYFLPKYSEQIISLAEEFLAEEGFTPEDLSSAIEDIDIGETAKEFSMEDSSEENNNTDHKASENTNEKTNGNLNENTNKNTSGDMSKKNIKNTSQKSSKSAGASPSGTIGGKDIKELEKQVSPKDRKDGLKIASKIDTGYLLGLAKGGVTAEEKKEAKDHLKQRLSSAEYQRLKGLVYKYIHLLQE